MHHLYKLFFCKLYMDHYGLYSLYGILLLVCISDVSIICIVSCSEVMAGFFPSCSQRVSDISAIRLSTVQKIRLTPLVFQAPGGVSHMFVSWACCWNHLNKKSKFQPICHFFVVSWSTYSLLVGTKICYFILYFCKDIWCDLLVRNLKKKFFWKVMRSLANLYKFFFPKWDAYCASPSTS